MSAREMERKMRKTGWLVWHESILMWPLNETFVIRSKLSQKAVLSIYKLVYILVPEWLGLEAITLGNDQKEWNHWYKG